MINHKSQNKSGLSYPLLELKISQIPCVETNAAGCGYKGLLASLLEAATPGGVLESLSSEVLFLAWFQSHLHDCW